jgi:hypothetical protein
MEVCRWVHTSHRIRWVLHHTSDALTQARQCPMMFAGDLNIDWGKYDQRTRDAEISTNCVHVG